MRRQTSLIRSEPARGRSLCFFLAGTRVPLDESVCEAAARLNQHQGAHVNIQDLRTLLDYHYWARDRMLKALEPLTQEQFTRELGSSFTSVQDTLGHVYSAEWAWHQRWTGTSPTSQLPRHTFPDVATVKRLWDKTEADVRG